MRANRIPGRHDVKIIGVRKLLFCNHNFINGGYTGAFQWMQYMCIAFL